MQRYGLNCGDAVNLHMAQESQTQRSSVWKGTVHASFKKVITFDLLFMVLGGMVGAGIITAIWLH